MNHNGAESFTLAGTSIRLLDNSNGILSELFPEMKRTFGGRGEGFRVTPFLLACWASTCVGSERRKIKGLRPNSRTQSSIASFLFESCQFEMFQAPNDRINRARRNERSLQSWRMKCKLIPL